MTVRLSDKHGVNPTMGVCYWCGEPDGTIALLGRLPNDAEAERYTCLSYEPCDTCKEWMERGVVVIEAQEMPKQEGQPEIQEGVYPTGRWSVLRREAAERLFTEVFDADSAKATLELGKCYMQPEVYEGLGFLEFADGPHTEESEADCS